MRSVVITLGYSRKYKSIVLTAIKILSSIYGIWSLDFFRAQYRNICLGLDTLETQALEYTIAVYPLLLILLSYSVMKVHDLNFRCVTFVCKPFHALLSAFSRNFDTTRSLVDAYTVFFILSLTKIVYVSFDLLFPTKMYTLSLNGTLSHQWVLYFDGSKEYFGKEHLPFGILAVVVMSIFLLLPTLVLCLFPFKFFQHFLYSLHCIIPLRHFVEKFQGYFQNGRDPGTHDYRCFSVFHIFLFLLMFSVYAFTYSVLYYSLGAGVLILAAFIYAVVQPYKSAYSHYTKINVAFLLLLGFQYAMIAGSDTATIKDPHLKHLFYVLASSCCVIPLVYISVVVVHRLGKRLKFKQPMVQIFREWRQPLQGCERLSRDSEYSPLLHESVSCRNSKCYT